MKLQYDTEYVTVCPCCMPGRRQASEKIEISRNSSDEECDLVWSRLWKKSENAHSRNFFETLG